MKNVSLKEMIEELTDCLLNQKEPSNFYYKTEYEEGRPQYFRINEVDLLDSRFRTDFGEFSEYEWELNESHIYKDT